MDDIARRIAETIESRPVLGYWPHMHAAADATYVRNMALEIEQLTAKVTFLTSAEKERTIGLLDSHEECERIEAERDALRAALLQYGAHIDKCLSRGGAFPNDCSCGLMELIDGATVQPKAAPDDLHLIDIAIPEPEHHFQQPCEWFETSDKCIHCGWDGPAHVKKNRGGWNLPCARGTCLNVHVCEVRGCIRTAEEAGKIREQVRARLAALPSDDTTDQTTAGQTK